MTGTSYPNENGGTSKKVIASAVTIGAIGALGIILTVSSLFDGDTESAPPPATTASATDSSPTTPAAPAADASACGLTAVQLNGTVPTAPTATWSLLGTIAAPAIKGQGPGKIDPDGYRSCYARTPTGALLAAANYVAIASHYPLQRKFLERNIAPGPGRDTLLNKPIPKNPDDGTRIQITGFRVLKYSDALADVDIAFRNSNGALVSFVYNLIWSGGDWKMQLANDGEPLNAFTPIPSMAGYVTWSGA
ncbi:MAG: hypothetical protein ACRC0L_03510 [Angustibacter sp.]